MSAGPNSLSMPCSQMVGQKSKTAICRWPDLMRRGEADAEPLHPCKTHETSIAYSQNVTSV